MSAVFPFEKSKKLQVLSIYILEGFEGSIIARFVFSTLSLLSIQQIGAFPTAIILFKIEYCRNDVLMKFISPGVT